METTYLYCSIWGESSSHYDLRNMQEIIMYSQRNFYTHAARKLITCIAPPNLIETKARTGYKFSYASVLAVCFLVIMTTLLMGFRAPLAHAEIRFEDITSTAGVTYAGPSHGASWGDFNRDGWPDLWVSNHTSPPNLFQNNKDGMFSEVSAQVNYTNADMHGSAWADFDNDGDQDLLMLVGSGNGVMGGGLNQFFVNSDGLLVERAQEYGLDYYLGRGRTPNWFDWDNDGRLDVFVANAARSDGAAPSALFSQADGIFLDSVNQTGLATFKSNSFGTLISLGSENTSVLVIHASRFPDRIYDYGQTPFVDLNETMGLFPSSGRFTVDAAIADFNGDLLPDV
ncbi:MAG: VCBS repeat-containing protein [Gammaproteobacteria bacterium]|nr:VCBS repeat-containing protein [Gammaproteobacteria bacterium]